MEAIELTREEIEVVELQLAGKININNPTEEQKQLLMGVIDRADELMAKLDAYDELDGDLIRWYYKKYKSQGQ